MRARPCRLARLPPVLRDGAHFNALTINLFNCCRALLRGGKDRFRFAMCPDYRKYLPYLEGTDLTEAQKVELIHSVWTIMESFADRAFGLHPAQQARAVGIAPDSSPQADRLGSRKDSIATHFKRAAHSSGRQEGNNHEGD